MAPKLERGRSGTLTRREAVMTQKSANGTLRQKPGKRKVKGVDKNATALLEAALKGKTAVIAKLLPKGVGVDTRDKLEGDTPLTLAASQGHVDFVKELLKNGCDIHAETDWKETALHKAVASDRGNVVSALLSAKADALKTDKADVSAIMLAASLGHHELFDMMLAATDAKATSPRTGNTMLHDCTQEGDVKSILKCLKHGCDVNAQNEAGNTPLHLAALQNSTGACSALLAFGPDNSIANKTGRTPITIATECGYFDLAAAIKKGAGRSAGSSAPTSPAPQRAVLSGPFDWHSFFSNLDVEVGDLAERLAGAGIHAGDLKHAVLQQHGVTDAVVRIKILQEAQRVTLAGAATPPPPGDSGLPPPPGADFGMPPSPGGDSAGLPPPPGGSDGFPPPPGVGSGLPPPPGGSSGGFPPPPENTTGGLPPPPGAGFPPPPGGSNDLPPPPGVGSGLPPPPGGSNDGFPPPPGGSNDGFPPPPGGSDGFPPPPAVGSGLPPPPGGNDDGFPPPPAAGFGLPPPPGGSSDGFPPPPAGAGGLPPPPGGSNDGFPPPPGGMGLPPPPGESDGFPPPPPF